MLETYTALILFLFPLAYSPGPGNLFFAANTARFGFWAMVPANVGYHVATFWVTLLVGGGFLQTAAQFPQVFVVIKGAGAVYVAWLGWRVMRVGVAKETYVAQGAGFWDGVVLLVLNPKAYLIMGLMFSQFSQANIWVVTGIFTLNNMLAFVVWSLAGDVIARRFREPKRAAQMNGLLGGMLIVVAIWMVWT